MTQGREASSRGRNQGESRVQHHLSDAGVLQKWLIFNKYLYCMLYYIIVYHIITYSIHVYHISIIYTHVVLDTTKHAQNERGRIGQVALDA